MTLLFSIHQLKFQLKIPHLTSFIFYLELDGCKAKGKNIRNESQVWHECKTVSHYKSPKIPQQKVSTLSSKKQSCKPVTALNLSSNWAQRYPLITSTSCLNLFKTDYAFHHCLYIIFSNVCKRLITKHIHYKTNKMTQKDSRILSRVPKNAWPPLSSGPFLFTLPQTKHSGATPALSHRRGDKKTDWQTEDVGLLLVSLSPRSCCPEARPIQTTPTRLTRYNSGLCTHTHTHSTSNPDHIIT